MLRFFLREPEVPEDVSRGWCNPNRAFLCHVGPGVREIGIALGKLKQHAGENMNEVCVPVSDRELDGLRLRRRLVPQYRGIEVEKSGNEFPAAIERCDIYEPRLKVNAFRPGTSPRSAHRFNLVRLTGWSVPAVCIVVTPLLVEYTTK